MIQCWGLVSNVVKLFLLLGCLTLLVSRAQATTYYVSVSDGNDNNTGLSSTPGSNGPWQSINKVSGFAFSPGDIINFKRGDTWLGAGTLTINDAGTSTNPITFQSYGSGVKPILDGNGLGNVKARMFGAAYIVFRDFILRNNGDSGAPGLTIDNNSHDITVVGVNVDTVRGIGIMAETGYNILIDSCTVTNGGNGGIQFYGTLDPATRIRNSTIQNCIVVGSLGNDGICIHEGYPYDGTLLAGTNFIIQNNLSTGNREQGYDITAGSGILLENNISRNNQQGAITTAHSAHDVTIRYHTSEDEPTSSGATIALGGQNITIEYSTFTSSSVINNELLSMRGLALSGPFTNDLPVENIVIRNNVFMWNNTGGGAIFAVRKSPSEPTFLHHLTVINNIFSTRTSANPSVAWDGPTVDPNYDTNYIFNNNIYYSPGGIGWNVAGTGYSFTSYTNTFLRDLTSKTTDPMLVNPATGDFHLASTSSSAFNSGTNVGISADADGIPVPQGNGRDIGAFEYPFENAPTSLSAVANGSSRIDLSWIDNSADEIRFRIERKLGSGSYGFLTNKAAVGGTGNVVTYSDTGLIAGTNYTYHVRAESGTTNSTWSNESSASTPVSAPEIDVRGGSPLVSIADGDSTPTNADWTDFGSADIAAGTVSRTFTITNMGTATLSNKTVTISGTGAADFSITTQPGASVAVGGNTTFTVQFNPSATGLRSAALSFTNNDPNENPFNFSIQGSGTSAPEIDVQGGSPLVSIVDGDASPIIADGTDFGSANIAGTTVSHIFTITNTGSGSLAVGAVSAGGDFSVTTQPATSVAAGGSTTFTVLFNPSATGVRTATLSFTNTDANETPYNFSIQGTGTSGSVTNMYEAELLSAMSSIGAGAISTFAETNASGGTNSLFTATNVNNFITYTSNVPAGTYDVRVMLNEYSSRGKCNLYVDGTLLGSEMDLYTNTGSYVYREVDQGNVTFSTSGNHTFKFQVSAQGIGGGCKLAFDYLKLIGSSNGSLVGSVANASSSYTLGSGQSDWAYWNGTFIHKSTGGTQITNVTQIGGGTYGTFNDASRSITWSSGTPTSSGTSTNYIWCNGTANSGWTFTAPASTTSRKLHIVCGGATGATMKITAHLSDSSAADYTDTQTSASLFTKEYTLTYQAASASQMLTITVIHTNSGSPSCDLITAWLE